MHGCLIMGMIVGDLGLIGVLLDTVTGALSLAWWWIWRLEWPKL